MVHSRTKTHLTLCFASKLDKLVKLVDVKCEFVSIFSIWQNLAIVLLVKDWYAIKGSIIKFAVFKIGEAVSLATEYLI